MEKRKFPRVPAVLRIRYRVLRKDDMIFTDDEAVSRDMSLGGLALALGNQTPLSKDDMVRIEVIEGKAAGVRAYAEVAWSHDDAVGLPFMGILDEDSQRLSSMFQEQA